MPVKPIIRAGRCLFYPQKPAIQATWRNKSPSSSFREGKAGTVWNSYLCHGWLRFSWSPCAQAQFPNSRLTASLVGELVMTVLNWNRTLCGKLYLKRSLKWMQEASGRLRHPLLLNTNKSHSLQKGGKNLQDLAHLGNVLVCKQAVPQSLS